MKVRARVTSQNQITVPVEVRRRLGVERGGTIVFDITDDAIRIEGRELTLEEIFGSIKLPEPASEDFDVEIEEAMELETARYLDASRLGAS